MSPVYSIDMPMKRCAIRSGAVAPCFSASVRNCGELTHYVAVKRHEVRDPEAIRTENNSSGSSGGSPQGFNLFDQQTCSLQSYLGFRRGLPFDVHE